MRISHVEKQSKYGLPTPQDGPFGDAPNWAACAWKPTRVVQLEQHTCRVVYDRYQMPANVWPSSDYSEGNMYVARALPQTRLCV